MDVEIKFTKRSLSLLFATPFIEMRDCFRTVGRQYGCGQIFHSYQDKIVLYLLGALPLSHYFIEDFLTSQFMPIMHICHVGEEEPVFRMFLQGV